MFPCGNSRRLAARSRHGWAALLVASLASIAPAGCRPGPTSPGTASDEQAADQLLFSLPGWCGKGPRRQGWVEWHKARQRAPTGNGLCGVTLSASAAPGTKDDGMCVEFNDGKPVRTELRLHGQPLPLVASPPRASWGDWVEMTYPPALDGPVGRSGGALLFRAEGSRLTARAGEGPVGEGPCFWR
jgi:hypothetical protein